LIDNEQKGLANSQSNITKQDLPVYKVKEDTTYKTCTLVR
jgi:hypothetical protein